jgi:hypothetical protein
LELKKTQRGGASRSTPLPAPVPTRHAIPKEQALQDKDTRTKERHERENTTSKAAQAETARQQESLGIPKFFPLPRYLDLLRSDLDNSLYFVSTLTLNQFNNWFSIKGIHNRSSLKLSNLQEQALSLGLKFIPTPNSPCSSILKASFTDFFRKIKLKLYFAARGPSLDNREFQIKFWLPGSSFTPELADLKPEEAAIVSRLHHSASKLCDTTIPPPRRNIPVVFLKELNALSKNTTVVIKPADKNLGLTMVNRSWYISEVALHLCEPTYESVQPSDVPISGIITLLREIKDRLLKAKVITKQMAFFITSNIAKFRVPLFYLLIKLHKPQLCGRPICSSVGWLLHPLSMVLDHLLQPFLRRTRSYLPDSTALLRLLHSTEIPSNAVLVTADVASLYPSIPPEGIDIVMQFLYSPLFSDLKKPPFLREALKLVLENNYVQFQQSYFLQKSGTAMGTPVAVCYASLFLAALESKLSTSPQVYRRFIDDIFAVCKPNEVQAFKLALSGMHPSIKLTFETSDMSVDFLDLTIHKGDLFQSSNRLDTSLFQKPFNKFLYLPWHSYHDKLQKKAFILGLLTTFIRVCSSEMTFLKFRKLFFLRLRMRGYPVGFLRPLFEKVVYSSTLRESLIGLAPKPPGTRALPLTFKMMASPAVDHLKIRDFLTLTHDSLSALPNWHTDSPPRLCLSRPPTIGQLLTSSRLPDPTENTN